MRSFRDVVVGALISSKLSLRRAFRRWQIRRVGSGSAAPAVLHSSGLDTESDNDEYSKDASLVLDRNRTLFPMPSSRSARMLLRGARLPNRPQDEPQSPYIVCLVLLVFALCVRLWQISEPRSTVFDEVHFGKFVKAYWQKSYYFDIHPPLGKLILYSVSRIFSSQGPLSDFKYIGQPYEPNDSVYIPMRISSACFGAVVPPVTFLIARELGLSFPASIVPAIAQLFDNLVITESRLILMDAQLLCFMSACLLCALRLWATPKRTRRRVMYLLAAAILGACALSVKWTALATPGLVAVVSLLGVPFPRDGTLEIGEMLVAGGLAVIVYTAFFYIHFALLPFSGAGDRFMRNEFQRTLIGSPMYDASAQRPSFLSNFFYLNARMLSASAHITTRHTWESKWYQWIISYRGVLYHVVYGSSKQSKVFLIGNLAVIYPALLSVIASVAIIFVRYLPKLCSGKLSPYDKLHGFAARGMFLLAGYLLNLAPYIAVQRCTFLYHYVPALFYGELLLANVIHLMPNRYQRLVSILAVVLIALAFLWWSPWIYSTNLTPAQHNRRAIYGESWT